MWSDYEFSRLCRRWVLGSVQQRHTGAAGLPPVILAEVQSCSPRHSLGGVLLFLSLSYLSHLSSFFKLANRLL